LYVCVVNGLCPLSTVEFRQAIVAMMNRKDELDELNM
jgi:hypothetical protein